MTASMLLSTLLPDIAQIPPGLAITGLVQDSRAVQPGNAFVAIGEFGPHGLRFAAQARAAGAVAVLFEPPVPDDIAADLPAANDAIAVPGLRARLGVMADTFHGSPSASMTTVGVTGTNGKTSTVQMLAQAWTLHGLRCGTIGTLGAGLYGDPRPTGFTTPLVLQTHALLGQLRDDGADAVAMEVSSHALAQGRVDAVAFKVAVFTNLTRDHLDYHGDMATYGAVKASLFAMPGLQSAVINIDDMFGKSLHAALASTPSPPLAGERAGVRGISATGAHALDVDGEQLDAPLTSTLSPASGGEGAKRMLTIGEQTGHSLAIGEGAKHLRLIGVSARGDASAIVRAHNIVLDGGGIAFDLCIGTTTSPIRSPLLGRFNVDNLLAVAGVLHALDEPTTTIAPLLARLQPVAGRMNRLGGDGHQPLVVIDYSHTPDALLQALTSLRAHAHGRLICVFGCGGERDRGKRAEMAAIAETHADLVIVTDDNPRAEDGDAIVADVLQGFARRDAVIVQRDRHKAVARAVDDATAADIVLVAGKGHESYQEIAGVRHDFDDTVVARALLEARP